jgi:hypothetical protein
MAKETNIDCMKYRNSTHLAGVDVDAIINEKGSCILTIKEAYYSKTEISNGKKVGVVMNGKVVDGYYIEFIEDVKPMAVNSGNRKTIADIVKRTKNISNADSRNVSSWIGLTIELYFDENVVFGSERTGGIKIKPTSPIPNISDANAILILSGSTTLQELQANWSSLSKQEQALPTVNSLKDSLKEKLSK